MSNITKKQKAAIVKVNPFTSALEYFQNNIPTICRNDITKDIEIEGEATTTQKLNSHFIRISGECSISMQHFETLLNSDHIPSYNPLANYFSEFEGKAFDPGFIDALVDSLDFNHEQNMPKKLAAVFIRKWLIGVIAGIYSNFYNPIFFILVGPKGCGKTEFYRRLLPDRLRLYLAETKLDAGKDDEAKACENLLLFVDEMDFLTKREASELRRFISQNFFTYRPPYGKKNIKRKRIASLCGTSNRVDVINDHHNNRRLIPIMINRVDRDKYNAIDKEKLFAEAFHLFKAGEDWNLTEAEIKGLDDATIGNAVNDAETELLITHYRPSDQETYTATEITSYLRGVSNLQLSVFKVGKALAASGFKKVSKRENGIPCYVWQALCLNKWKRM